ncbi:MAG: biopolymer transporter ExbD [Nitrospirae bacterium]|nr:biopolymer transporter ExbD [Nitrospirota bacterium]
MMEARQRRFLAEINVVPLVDVVLVLLVIFMVTAPMLHRGLDVKLPTSTSNTIKAEERVVVTVERDQKIYMDKELVGAVQLEGKLRALKQQNPEVGVYLRADRTVPYGSVVQVMDSVKRAGIEKMGMVTDAPGEERVVEDPIRSKSKGAGR